MKAVCKGRDHHVKRRTVLAAAASLTLSLLSLLAVECVYGQTSPETSSGIWTMRSPLPAVRAEVAAVALNGKLHALGGSFDGKAGAYHDSYDPATDRWRPAAPLPASRDHLAAAGGERKDLCLWRLCC